MYSLIIAVMLTSGTNPELPLLMESYKTLNEGRLELVEISKLPEYELVVSPLLSYSVAKETEDKTTMAFCVKNMKSI
jgi:hypothetical protein